MLKHYVEFIYPGILSCETTTNLVKSRNVKIRARKGAIAYRFFDQEETKKGGEVLVGRRKNYSGCHYFTGEILTLADVRKKYPTERILIDNMEINNYKKVVHTKYSWFPLEKGDVVLKTA